MSGSIFSDEASEWLAQLGALSGELVEALYVEWAAASADDMDIDPPDQTLLSPTEAVAAAADRRLSRIAQLHGLLAKAVARVKASRRKRTADGAFLGEGEGCPSAKRLCGVGRVAVPVDMPEAFQETDGDQDMKDVDGEVVMEDEDKEVPMEDEDDVSMSTFIASGAPSPVFFLSKVH